MPASSFNLYYMQDARNNFDAMRPVPVCADANQTVGQCQQKIHISTNCYYGYHSSNNTITSQPDTDCEMAEEPAATEAQPFNSAARKRSADDDDYPLTKRLREEVQRKRKIVPETSENLDPREGPEDLIETLFWNTHGGNIYHLLQCLCFFHVQPRGNTVEAQPFSFRL